MIMTNEKLIRKRNRAEKRFRAYGVLSLLAAGSVLMLLIYTIVSSGYSAFFRASMLLDVQLDAAQMDVTPPYTQDVLSQGRYAAVVKQALYAQFPDVVDRKDRRLLARMLSPGAEQSVRDYLIDHPDRIGSRVSLEVPLSSDFDQLYKEHLPRTGDYVRFNAAQLQWYDRLRQEGRIHYRFNTQFLLGGDSRYPELAGIGGAVMGSLFALLVCFLLLYLLREVVHRHSRNVQLVRRGIFQDGRL